MEVDEPLQYVPFKRLHIGQVEQVYGYIRRNAGIKGELENKHFSPRAAELRWNKALKEEDLIESEHDIHSEKVPPPAQ